MFTEVNSAGAAIENGKQFKPSDLKKRVAIINDAPEKNKTHQNAYNEFLSSVGYDGAAMYNDLMGATSNETYNVINDCLEKLDKDNIVPFLQSYYDESGYPRQSWINSNGIGHDVIGLIENLDTERDSHAISMENKIKPAQALRAAAEDLGLKDTPEYNKVNTILRRYEDNGRYADCDNLRGASQRGSSVRNGLLGGAFAAGGTLVGAVGTCAAMGAAVTGPYFLAGAIVGCVVGVGIHFGMRATDTGLYTKPDCAQLDEAMYALHKKIKEKLGQETMNYQTTPIKNSGVIRETNPPKRTMGVYEA